jgi:hypothetical protein
MDAISGADQRSAAYRETAALTEALVPDAHEVMASRPEPPGR